MHTEEVSEYILQHMHGFVLLLLQLLQPMNSLFQSEVDVLRSLLRHQLMKGPQTHSALQDIICWPYKQQQQQTQLIDSVLAEVNY